jgi:hypothetical protein
MRVTILTHAQERPEAEQRAGLADLANEPAEQLGMRVPAVTHQLTLRTLSSCTTRCRRD